MGILGLLSYRERHVAAFNLLMALLFLAFVMASTRVPTINFLRMIAQYIPLTMGLTTMVLLIYLAPYIRKGTARTVLAERWRKDRFITLLWPMVIFALVMPTFSAFKQRILPLAGFGFDPVLAGIDRAIFGVTPNLWVHQMLGTPLLTYFLDACYHFWFFPMTLGVGIVALYANEETRAQYMTAFSLTWIGMGSALAYLLPAAGPCYYQMFAGMKGSAPYDAVNADLLSHQIASGGRFLFTLEIRDMLLRRFDDPNLSMGGGISAIPSIHNAMAVLFALAGFRFNRIFGWVMTTFAILIWVGSIYLNWHYAIDGIVGAIGAIITWFLSGMLVMRLAPFSRASRRAARLAEAG